MAGICVPSMKCSRKGNPKTGLNTDPGESAQYEEKKLYISNLGPQVTSKGLRFTFEQYVTVIRAFVVKDEFTAQNRGFGFVEVGTPEEMERMLLWNGQMTIAGRKMRIKRAWKQLRLDYVIVSRPVLPDRKFDLDPLDNDRPSSIHCLNEDILLYIFKFFSVQEIIQLESVCRRWQAVVYRLFQEKTSYALKWGDRTSMGFVLSMPAISKLLLLSGLTLRKLRLSDLRVMKYPEFFKMIGNLCCNLEHITLVSCRVCLDEFETFVKKIPNLKGFEISYMPLFVEDHLKLLLENCSQLETLTLETTLITGESFSLLPETLKRLTICSCERVMATSLEVLPVRCPNLECYNIREVPLTPVALAGLLNTCTKLKELKMFWKPDCPGSFPHFPNLQVLDIRRDIFILDIVEIVNLNPQLEELYLSCKALESTVQNIDFGKITKLKKFSYRMLGLPAEVFKTLKKCKELEFLDLKHMETDVLLQLVEHCPNLKTILCENYMLEESVVDSLIHANHHRKHMLTICARTGFYSKAKQTLSKLKKGNICITNISDEDFYSISDSSDEDEDNDDDDDDPDDIDDYDSYGSEIEDNISDLEDLMFFHGGDELWNEDIYFNKDLGVMSDSDSDVPYV